MPLIQVQESREGRGSDDSISPLIEFGSSTLVKIYSSSTMTIMFFRTEISRQNNIFSVLLPTKSSISSYHGHLPSVPITRCNGTRFSVAPCSRYSDRLVVGGEDRLISSTKGRKLSKFISLLGTLSSVRPLLLLSEVLDTMIDAPIVSFLFLSILLSSDRSTSLTCHFPKHF